MLIKIMAQEGTKELMFSCVRYSIISVEPEDFKHVPSMDEEYWFGDINKAKEVLKIDLFDSLKNNTKSSATIFFIPSFSDKIYIMNDNGKTIETL